MSASFKIVKQLILSGGNRSSRLFSFAGLGIGVLLLFCCVQMYFNLKQLTRKNAIRKNGFDYIALRKSVTNETMGKTALNMFAPGEIADLQKQPFVTAVAPLIANNFRVQLSAGSLFDFQTDFFIEAIDNDFIDTLPDSFHWHEGDATVPMIISSDFIELYNTAFAPGYGLPQLSDATISTVVFTIICYDRNQMPVEFKGNIVAQSDRLNSFLVPKTFLDWANEKFGGALATNVSRLYIKTKDANNPEFLKFIDSKHYRINKDKTLFGRAKQIMQGVITGLGIFGLMVVVLALMLFSFYLQLMIAKSKDNLQLLLTLGYSPGWLSKKMSGQFIPAYILIVLIALALTQLFQFLFHKYVMYDRPELSSMLHISVFILAVLLTVLTIIANYRMVKKLLYRFGTNE
ncbi:MAG TPA: hypothetical protein PK319_05255 [Chitinophagaceae bacterium]|nr:hypothetical protein [Chitinophagaceae bacterium]